MNPPLYQQLTPLARRTRRLSPAWTPASDPGLAFWLDGADAATVTLVSGNVSGMLDKSPAAAAITTTGASGRPAYLVAAQNGRNALQFNGSTNSLFCNLAITQPYTAFFVSSVVGTGVNGGNPNTIFEAKDLVSGRLVGFHFTKFASAQDLMAR